MLGLFGRFSHKNAKIIILFAFKMFVMNYLSSGHNVVMKMVLSFFFTLVL